MLRNALTFLLLLFSQLLWSQQFDKARIIGGYNDKIIKGLAFDNNGNKYVCVSANDVVIIDSLSISPLTPPIFSAEYDLLLLKFDKDNNFIHFNRITNVFLFVSNVEIKFTPQNDLLLAVRVMNSSDIKFYNPNNILFKNIEHKVHGGVSQLQAKTILCKIKPTGQFEWVNLMYGVPKSNAQNINFEVDFCQKLDGTIYINFTNNYFSSSSIDTLFVLHSQVNTDTIITSQDQLILKFNSAGNYISHISPFISLNFTNSNFIPRFAITTLNNEVYFTGNIVIISEDSIKTTHGYEVLDTGKHFMLLKVDLNDSIEWVKTIGKMYPTNQSKSIMIDLDIDSTNNDILIAISSNPDILSMKLFPPSLVFGTYLTKLKPDGSIKWYQFLNNISNSSYKMNYRLKQQVLYAESKYFNGYFQDRLPYNFYGHKTCFIAYQDSQNNFISINSIYSDTVNLSNTIYKDAFSINTEGIVLVGGNFMDSITLPCNPIYNYDFNDSKSDVFLIEFKPILSIDTIFCDSMPSPSRKYLWRNSGYYYDTLQNLNGCDSVILLNVEIIPKYNLIDTIVLQNLNSPSGKYIWDSSGTYIDTLINRLGCDSILIIKLNVLQSRSYIDTSVCYFFRLNENSKTYTQTGYYIDTLINKNGYDSIIYIHLKINHNTSTLDTSYCNAVLSPSGKFWMHNSGYYSDTLTNSLLCDSIITIHF
ncbi:MAG: hypothetical protein IT237_00630, partial [Bacteroidia bacterium]|nr:hypothetical protein [Bacteroidia bacterium]